MQQRSHPIFIGDTAQRRPEWDISGEYVSMLDGSECLADPAEFPYMDVNGQQEQMELPRGSLAYSICQVPVLLQASDEPCINVYLADGSIQHINGHGLDSVNSRHIFQRDGVVHRLVVSVPADDH